MPLEYQIFESKKLIYVTGTGAVAFSELMRHIEELCKDPRYIAPMKKLVDYRQIKHLDLTMEEQERFAQKKIALKASYSGEKCAIAVPTDIGFGIARVHSGLSSGSDIETAVFRDLGEALAWLDIELDWDELKSV